MKITGVRLGDFGRRISALYLVVQIIFPHMVLAGTVVVTSNGDGDDPGTLRNALAQASDGDTINLSGISGIITLTNAELLITNSVTIVGPGPSNLAIWGSDGSPVFTIRNAGIVAISGLTITRSNFTVSGRGIHNEHTTLTLSNCTVSTNSSFSDGAGIYNNHSTLTVLNCTVSRNSAKYGGGINYGYYGGGIYNGYSTLVISNSTLSANSARQGGGIYNAGFNGSTSLALHNSTVSDNAAEVGGGIYSDGILSSNTTVKVYSSTVSGNMAHDGNGGGIFNAGRYGSGLGGQIEIRNSTISGNSAAFSGGGIYNHAERGSAYLKIQNSTFWGNSATYFGGAVLNDGRYGGQAIVEIGHTILSAGESGGTIVSVGDWVDSGAKVTSFGYNLSTDHGSGLLTASGDRTNADPLLGPLSHNGGLTRTHPLWPGSPAVDAGDPAFVAPPDFDQRGSNFQRIVNGRIDIGAFEVGEPKVAHLTLMNQLEVLRAGVTNRADAIKLDKAIGALASSVNITNWTGRSHLVGSGGKRVFANDVITVRLLIKLATSKRRSFDTEDLQAWIATVVFADRALAERTITEATGNTTKAQVAFNKGDAALAAGYPVKAILAYARAWKLVAR